MADSDERVHKGRNLRPKGQLRSKEIGLHVTGTRSRGAAVMAAKFCLDAHERKNLEGRGKFIPVQIRMPGNGAGHGGAGRRTPAYLVVGERRSKVGISGEDLQLLRESGGADG